MERDGAFGPVLTGGFEHRSRTRGSAQRGNYRAAYQSNCGRRFAGGRPDEDGGSGQGRGLGSGLGGVSAERGTAGLQDHGLRQVPLSEGQGPAGGAQEAEADPGQGGQVPTDDRGSGLSNQAAQPHALPG